MSSELPSIGGPAPQPPGPQPASEPAAVAGAEAALLHYFTSQAAAAGPLIDQAFARRVRPEHLAQLLDYFKLREQNRHKEVTGRVRTQPAVVVIVIVTVLVFTLLFGWLALGYGRPELVVPVLTGVGGLVGGAIGGYGYGFGRASKDL